MAYKIAQLRRIAEGEGTYMEDVQVIPSSSPSQSVFSDEYIFDDFALMVANDGYFKKGETYFLRIKIQRVPDGYYSKRMAWNIQDSGAFQDADVLDFSLFLLNQESTEDGIVIETNTDGTSDEQDIKSSFRVDAIPRENNTANIWYDYITVFTPRRNYNTLVFRMARITYDVLKPLGDYRRWLFGQVSNKSIEQNEVNAVLNAQGKTYKITTQNIRINYNGKDGDVCKLNNIIDTNKSNKWIKMGFQCRPGSLIVVNKEPIRVGRSGIYEINNGTPITSFMITASNGSTNSNVDAFLLDYAYQQS